MTPRLARAAYRPSFMVLIVSSLGGCLATTPPHDIGGPGAPNAAFTYDHGGIVRGDRSRRRIALIFTGGDYGDGAEHVLDTLGKLHVRAGIFVTGDFIRKSEYVPFLKRAVADGHYVGPHSDRHLLYAPWEDREKSLVTEEAFSQDLRKNIEDLKAIGALKGGARLLHPAVRVVQQRPGEVGGGHGGDGLQLLARLGLQPGLPAGERPAIRLLEADLRRHPGVRA